MFRDKTAFGARALLLFCPNKEHDFSELVALFYSAAVLSVPCVCITDSDLSFFCNIFYYVIMVLLCCQPLTDGLVL